MEPTVKMRVSEDSGIEVTYVMDWDTHKALGTASLELLQKVKKERELDTEALKAMALIAPLAIKIDKERERLCAELGITL